MRACLRRLWTGTLFLAAATLQAAEPAIPPPVTVVYQNLHNYFFPIRERGKSPESYDAVHRQLSKLNADVLVVSELNGPEALEHLRTELGKKGVHYPFSTLCRGGDEYRAIAMLAKRQPHAILHDVWSTYPLKEADHLVRRGFLHCVFNFGDYPLTILGAHLKSKVFDELGQSDMRRYEARLLRYTATETIKAHPTANMLVVGDMNDDPSSSPILSIVNNRFKEEKRLWDLRPLDVAGVSWTHHWKPADAYSRFDYAFASHGLLPELHYDKIKIADFPDWQLASDHRPLVIKLTPKNQEAPDRTKGFTKSIRQPSSP